MRPTLALDDAVLEQAKNRALLQHVSLAKFVEIAVREKLKEEVREPSVLYRGLKTFRGDGLNSKIDLNDSRSLSDILDS